MDANKVDERLVKNNAMAFSLFKDLISVLSNKTLKEVELSIHTKADELIKARTAVGLESGVEIDAKVAISELASLVCDEANHITITTLPKKVNGIWSPFEIPVVGVHNLRDQDIDTLKSEIRDFDVIEGMLYEAFVNVHNSQSAVVEFLQKVFRYSKEGTPIESPMPSDMYFAVDSLRKIESISANTVIKIFMADIVNELLQRTNKDIRGFVRVSNTNVEVVVDSRTKREVILTNNKAAKVNYYHVAYRTFSNDGGTGFGTMPVRCHEMFPQVLLQEIIKRKIRIDRVIIDSWTEVKSKKSYCILNEIDEPT